MAPKRSPKKAAGPKKQPARPAARTQAGRKQSPAKPASKAGADGSVEQEERHGLRVAVAALRAELERFVAGRLHGESFAQAKRPMAPTECKRLAQVGERFGLSPFEQNVLLLAAAVELDSSLLRLMAEAQEESAAVRPTFRLAFSVLAEPHWSAMDASGPLRRFRLVELLPGQVLATSPLKIDERILRYLTAQPEREDRLQEAMQRLAPGYVSAAQQETSARLLKAWTQAEALQARVCLEGHDAAHTLAVVSEMARTLQCRAYLLSAEALPKASGELEKMAVTWDRESRLERCLLLLDCEAGARPERAEGGPQESGRGHEIARFLERAGPAVMLLGQPLPALQAPAVRFTVPAPTLRETQRAWLDLARDRLPPEAAGRLAMQFDVPHAKLPAILALAQGELARAELAANTSGAAMEDAVWAVCRQQMHADELPYRSGERLSWEHLILPAAPQALLREIAAQVRARWTVLEEWGFGARERSPGVCALFTGPSGTGKTTAAAVLAAELQVDLIQVDLSETTSKWIGETEKNLSRLFTRAERSGAMLVFDEADALFGKRTAVKDSHDRHANQQVSYLLERLETFRGLAILTTNLADSIDSAFMRRFRFVVRFPFPGYEERLLMWQRVFPPQTPLGEVHFERLARLTISGAMLRNIALAGAFLAAGEGERVSDRHLVHAARNEFAKENKAFPEAEIL